MAARLLAPAPGSARVRQIHRWVSAIFTVTVAANFVAMLWGPPPPWIVYAPLLPLLLLLASGLVMLVRHVMDRRHRVPAPE